jgi:hypothetical protein
MRLSCNKDDPGYVVYHRAIAGGNKVVVYLDDVEVEEVTIADEEEGFLVRFRSGPDGKLLLTEDRQAVETERLTGNVRIEVAPA